MSHAYCTASDLRTFAGGLLSDTGAYPDSLLNTAILLAGDLVERRCKQWFYPLDKDVSLDGNDSAVLHFPVPVISVSALYINGDTTPLETTDYGVYSNADMFEDDRRNPRIKLRGPEKRRDIFSVSFNERVFRRGVKNQRVVGKFGFVDVDSTTDPATLSTPPAIVRAVQLLALEKIGAPLPGGSPPPLPAALQPFPVAEEHTDGHSIRYAVAVTPRRLDVSDVIKNPEVIGICKLYRAPIAIGSPDGFSWRN